MVNKLPITPIMINTAESFFWFLLAFTLSIQSQAPPLCGGACFFVTAPKGASRFSFGYAPLWLLLE